MICPLFRAIMKNEFSAIIIFNQGVFRIRIDRLSQV